MRLEYLWLGEFKNLIDFAVEIDRSQPVDVVVGRNGSGKSNLLEALIVIFRDLDLDPSKPTLEYRLRYQIRGQSVELDADPSRERGRLTVSVDGVRLTLKEFDSRADGILPGFVFGYYSGESRRFESHFDPHRRRYYSRLLAEEEGLPLRRLFLAEPFHSQFVLLAFLVDPDPALLGILQEYLGIESIKSIDLVLRQPEWSKDQDDRFWGAKGLPRSLMEAVFNHAIAPSREQARERRTANRYTTREHLHLHLSGEEPLRLVYEEFGSRAEFFRALESLDISDLLHELRVVVRVRGTEAAVEFRELSEGEQQLLIVLGLLKFTQADHSLLLLDEPDTHLNPAWSVRYTELLAEVMGDLPRSQVLMATHDPLVVAGLLREQVLLLEPGRDGQIQAGHPERDPRGMGVAALLTSDVYGLRSQLDLETQRLLDEKRLLASAAERTKAEDARLAELADLVADVDIAATTRDPLYREFVAAMSARESPTPPVGLSRSDIEERQRIAHDIAATLRDRGE